MDAKWKLEQRSKAQLVEMLLEVGHSELDGRVAELEAQLEEAQAQLESAHTLIREQEALVGSKIVGVDGNEVAGAGKRWTQIATGQPIGAGLCLFALDEDGNLWGTIFGRKPWTLLPADGLLEFPS